ncbi:MAG TPA: hypothetical protein VEK33_15055 [Terriglobales bacterium]|nr:hypothetical protein [Terriglobales bacterium]
MAKGVGEEHGRNERRESWQAAPPQIERDALDRELDAALANYAAVEPRSGLEQRVLANLEARRDHAPVGIGWRWLLASALTVVVLVLGLSLSSRMRKPQSAKAIDPRSEHAARSAQMGNLASHPQLPAPHRASVKAAAHRPRNSTALATAVPRLQQFPSPRPLSEQEMLLARYVAKYPEHAALIAEARAETLRRDAAEELREATSEPDVQP